MWCSVNAWLTMCECLCTSQDGRADLSTWSAQDVWKQVQGSTARLSDHSLPNQYPDTTAAGAAQCGHPAVGLQRQFVPQCERGAEESRAAEFGGADLMDGMDRCSRWTHKLNWFWRFFCHSEDPVVAHLGKVSSMFWLYSGGSWVNRVTAHLLPQAKNHTYQIISKRKHL